jgi:hypothetical protein
MMNRTLALALLCSAYLLLQGCAAWQVNQLAAELPAAGPAATLSRLQQIQVDQRDQAQHLLDTGILKLYLGQFAASREDLLAAKQIMISTQAISVTENLAALTTNETLRVYSGSASDRVLVHVMLALGYLMSDDLDGARVEMLQADVTMQELAKNDSTSGQLASARYLAGLVYELNGERDDALISYRRAYNIMSDRGERIPEALQLSLLNLTKRQGFPKEYDKYSAQFQRDARLPAPDEGEWFLFYFDGVVSSKTENRLSVFNAEADTMISVVMPHYYPSQYQPRFLTMVAETRQRSSIVEHLETRVREDLEQQNAKLLVTATARAVAKYNLVQNAKEQSEFGGLLMNIATVASEQADVRSWNMLPASLQIARMTTKLNQPIELAEVAQSLPALAQFAPGRRAVLLVSSLDGALYGWPPLPEHIGGQNEASPTEASPIETPQTQGETDAPR